MLSAFMCNKSATMTSLRSTVFKHSQALCILKSYLHSTSSQFQSKPFSHCIRQRAVGAKSSSKLLFSEYFKVESLSTLRKIITAGPVFRLGQLNSRGSVFAAVRTFSTSVSRLAPFPGSQYGKSNKTGIIYITAVFIFMIGGAYAAVPLYKVFCQTTGRGGQAVIWDEDEKKVETMEKVDRKILVRFNADVASSMRWNFRPQQTEVTVSPGETALAFYTARNPTDKPIIGISTYNVLPFEAGYYFNKIQCFCFEEQRLNPNEQVDMPVFFYIDPEFAEDPKLEHVDNITLSYTFFEAREGLQLPLPGYPQPHDPPVMAAS